MQLQVCLHISSPAFIPVAKAVLASIAALQTPVRDDSPSSMTPETKKVRSPEKVKTPKSSTESKKNSVELPVHYKRLVDDLRILDETLSLFRLKNQTPYFALLKENIERASGRRFTIDHFRQLMTATEGVLFKPEWQQVKDAQDKVFKYDISVRAVDHEREGVEIFKRLNSDQTRARKNIIIRFLEAKLSEYFEKAGASGRIENAYPVKPYELPAKPHLDSGEEIGENPSTPFSGRSRVLSKCDSVASDGSAVKTPKSSLRRQLSVSASPVMPNVFPQFVSSSTPIKHAQTPMSAKEKLQAIRDRVKVKEEKDVAEAKEYDAEMEKRSKLDEFDLAIKLLIKLHHKFPRGIDSAKLSTLIQDYGSLFVNADDVEKWTKKICDLVPHRFEMIASAEDTILRYKTTDVKFSTIKKEIEDQKLSFASASIRE